MKIQYAAFLFLAALSGNVNGQWNAMNPMSTIRAGHISAALNNGNVLVAGGWDYTTNLKTAEVFDASSNSWSSTPEMSSEHYNAASVTLDNGQVLVIAGYTGTFNTETCELYDPSSNTWSSAGDLTQGRSFFTATKLSDGKVLVVGGFDGSNNLSSCEIYDPALNSWSAASSLNTGRSYHIAALLGNGKVLIAGGYNPNAGYQLSSTELYDPVENSWSAGPDMLTARDFHAASTLGDGSILVTGGRYFNGSTNFAYNGLSSAERYNPASNSWTTFPSIPSGISYHQQVTLGDGNVLVIAGVDSSNYSSGTGFTTFPTTTYLLHPISGIWEETSMIQDSRYEHGVTVMTDGNALVTGGVDASVELFGSITNIKSVKNSSIALNIFPNPGKGLIRVESPIPSKGIVVYDLLGKKVNVPFQLMEHGFILNTENLKAGCYLVCSDNLKQRLIIEN